VSALGLSGQGCQVECFAAAAAIGGGGVSALGLSGQTLDDLDIWPAAFAGSFDEGQGSKCGVPPLPSLTSPGR
jgi:hypothetical protein